MTVMPCNCPCHHTAGIKHVVACCDGAAVGDTADAVFTADRDTVLMQDADKQTARFYTTEQLSARQSVTPEGFLVLHDVPIARVGSQVYAEHELPGLRGKSGVINIRRDADEVFRDESIRSFHGKPVTNNHPPEKVTPDNYRDYAVGTVLNPHQGDGTQFDKSFLYVDMLITDRRAMADIKAGKREVSAGYDAEYEQTQDGEGRQYAIVGNHVALVNRGRCGPLCYIGDDEMAGVTVRRVGRRTLGDRIMDAFTARDEGALVEELDRVPELMGRQVVGEPSGEVSRDADGHHVEINLHGLGGAGGSHPASAAHLGAADDPSGGAPGGEAGGGAEAGAGGGDVMQQILQRLDAIEQAIVILAQGDEGGGEAAGGAKQEEDDGFRDEEAGAPNTEDPSLKPGNALPYGAGSEGKGRDGPQLGAGGTRDRRSTTDSVRTAKRFVGDSSSMKDAFHDTVARAVMLVPDFKVPTFDSATPARTTFDALCNMRREVLNEAYHDKGKREVINAMLNGEPPAFKGDDGMTCDSVALVFNGASEMVRQANNNRIGSARTTAGKFGTAASPADINAINREKYGVPAR